MTQNLCLEQVMHKSKRIHLDDVSNLISKAVNAYNIDNFDEAMNLALQVDQKLYEEKIDMLNLSYQS